MARLEGVAAQGMGGLFTAGTLVGLADRELVERFAGGERAAAEAAFSALVERHGALVWRVCRTVLRDTHDAEDAFQATWLVLARKAATIRRRDSVAAWLHGVAYHVAMTARAASARRRAHEATAGLAGARSAAPPPGDDLGGVVLDELNRLPDRYRAAVALCCLEGLSQLEAAERMGWPLGTLQSRLARGRERLRIRLTRRGVAPATALAAALGTAEVAQATAPAALVRAAARLGGAAAISSRSAVGVVPATIQRLATGGLRSMVFAQVKPASLALILAVGLIATGAVAWTRPPVAAPPPVAPPPVVAADTPAGDGMLTIAGRVVLPDGSPAAGAIVRAQDIDATPARSTVTDAAGRFELRDQFGNGGRVTAQSADGRFRVAFSTPPFLAMSTFEGRLTLPLAATTPHAVTVLAEGRPVPGASVMAKGGDDSEVFGQTDADGRVELRWLDTEHPDRIVAWHPRLGVNEVKFPSAGLPDAPTQITLLPVESRTIRAVDPKGNAVAGLELGLSFRREEGWIQTQAIEAARVRLDDAGSAVVPWAPRGPIQAVAVAVFTPGWKVDAIDQGKLAEGLTTVQVRAERTVTGRLIVPVDVNPEGILISGFGFGPKGRGHAPTARARRDGTFTLAATSEHRYDLGVDDLNFISSQWSGVILPSANAESAAITLNLTPATPLMVHVTRGPQHEPVANALVEIRPKQGPRTWARTNGAGVLHAGVAPGENRVRLMMATWDEEQVIQVTADRPVIVEFTRPWLGQRRITGRLMNGSTPAGPTPTLELRAFFPQPYRPVVPVTPLIRPDGTFEVTGDGGLVTLVAIDKASGRAGFGQVEREQTTLDLALEPSATYAGTLRDEAGQPLAGRTVQFLVKAMNVQGVFTPRSDVIATQTTDAQGRFRVTDIPANVPLRLEVPDQPGTPAVFLFDNDRLFQPGEVREGKILVPKRVDNTGAAINPPPVVRSPSSPLAGQVEATCRNAQVAGMQVVMLLPGDDSPAVTATADRLLDDDQTPAILGYLPIRVKASAVRAEAPLLARNGAALPAAGEVVLVVLDDRGKAIATERLPTAGTDPTASARVGREFLTQHRPPTHDAATALREAHQQAAATDRRVWVILGGPRCGPCFLLARWIEEHRSTLERDYVIVKLMQGVDDHYDALSARLGVQPGDGVPWFAFTEADGTVLATSVGPLGNIGFPGAIESLRHFRTMLDRSARNLTGADREALVQSLQP